MKKRGIKHDEQIKESNVKEEIIFGSLVDDLYMALVENSHNLNSIIGDKNIYIKEYNDSILNFMKIQRENCLEKRRVIKLGGFFNWVDKNIFNK